MPVYSVDPWQERDYFKCFYLYQPAYNSNGFSAERDLTEIKTKRGLLQYVGYCLAKSAVCIQSQSLYHLWPSLGFYSESLGTVCCLIEPSEIILGESYFCKPEYID